METEEKIRENSYRTILKRLSSLGGVQVFNVVIALIRGKLIALLLGAEGMGISSLFTSSSNTLQQLGALGLNLSMAREVAVEKDNPDRLAHVIAVSTRLIILTSLLGAAICVILAPLLSLWSFGNYDNSFSFMTLGGSVFFSIGSIGYMALLQGMGRVKRLTYASVVGGLTGLLGGIPLYYFFGNRGIVPALILFWLAMFLFYYLSFRKTVDYEKIRFQWNSHRPLVKKLISLGLILMTGNLFGTLTNYLINIFVRYSGSIEDVGLFQAANSLTNQYVGVIFSALSLDYFPRLSAAAADKLKFTNVINRQVEIVMLVATPLVILLILSTPLVIEILLTESFLEIIPLMRWLGFGILIQAVAIPLDYALIAKEKKKIYFWFEVIWANFSWIGWSILFYYLFGLVGLGVSLVVRSAIDFLIICVISRKSLQFTYSNSVTLITLVSLLLCAGVFAASFLPVNLSYFAMGTGLTASIIFSYTILRKKLGSTPKD